MYEKFLEEVGNFVFMENQPESADIIFVPGNRIFFRTYYTVKTTKTNNIYKKVMYCGKEEINIGSTYVLYEICGVRYIQ